MPRDRLVALRFPEGGLVRNAAYQSQPPYTTYDARNALPRETLEGRVRGGSRPGVDRFFFSSTVGGVPRLLADVNYKRTDKFRYWEDEFSGTELSLDATNGPWTDVTTATAGINTAGTGGTTIKDATNTPFNNKMIDAVITYTASSNTYTIDSYVAADEVTVTPALDGADDDVGDAFSIASALIPFFGSTPPTVSGGLARIGLDETGATKGGVLLKERGDWDHDNSSWAGIFIAPDAGAHVGTYYVFLGVPNTPTVLWGSSAYAVLTLTGNGGGTLRVWIAGISGGEADYQHNLINLTATADRAGWLWLKLTPSTKSAAAFWQEDGISETNANHTPTSNATRAGFSAWVTESGKTCLIDKFRVMWNSTDDTVTESGPMTAMVVESSDNNRGELFREIYVNQWSRPDHTVGVSSYIDFDVTHPIQAVELRGKLYIADYSTEPLRTSSTGVIDTPNTTFDDPGLADWTTLGADWVAADANHNYLLNVTGTGAGSGAKVGVFRITAVIADNLSSGRTYGTAGETGIEYEIVRCPKVFDPSDRTFLPLYADEYADGDTVKGHVPLGCPLIAAYRDRLVFAGSGDAPHLWYMSRQGDPRNWDYASDPDDPKRAVAGEVADAGQIGKPIRALISHGDDYLVFACNYEMWVLRGDPAFAGEIANLSRVVGVVGANAWCNLPDGETVILSYDGLYGLAPGATSYPRPLSRNKLPRELRNLSADHWNPILIYDEDLQGVWIFISSDLYEYAQHWFFDWRTQSFWPVTLPDDFEPGAALMHHSWASSENCVLLGCRDGIFRRFHPRYERDGNAAIDSYVYYGPLAVDPSGYEATEMKELSATLDENGGPVDWSLYGGKNPQAAHAASVMATGSWNAGEIVSAWPRRRAGSFWIKVAGSASTPRAWAIEYIRTVQKRAGKLRE